MQLVIARVISLISLFGAPLDVSVLLMKPNIFRIIEEIVVSAVGLSQAQKTA